MCSSQPQSQPQSEPQDYKPINCYLMPPQSIVMTDQTITCETPLMNGIYYTSFTNQVKTCYQFAINFHIDYNV
jgi:hypothetical protein